VQGDKLIGQSGTPKRRISQGTISGSDRTRRRKTHRKAGEYRVCGDGEYFQGRLDRQKSTEPEGELFMLTISIR